MTRGKSHSIRPVSKRAPAWCKYSPEEAEAFVIKLAKDGVPQSRIGAILRDQYGIPLVKPIVGKSISEILKAGNLKSPLPEDLSNLINKANRTARHLSRNKADAINRHALERIESKVRRLAKYYVKRGDLPEGWKYSPEIAAT